MRYRFLCAALLAAAVPDAPAQSVLHVPASFPDIQAAFDAAAGGDEIHLAAGTYVGVGNRDVSTHGKSVRLLGLGGAAATVIDCQAAPGNPHRALTAPGGTGLVVEAITIRNGHDGDGGGCLLVNGASASFVNVLFEQCRADQRGGAAFVDGPGTSASFVGCTFDDGDAGDGGAVAIRGQASATFAQCDFQNNAATYGGAVRLDGGTASFDGCDFLNNAATQRGGGLDVGWSATVSSAAVTGGAFQGNTADNGGGLNAGPASTVTVDGATFSGNAAGWSGGGLVCEWGAVVSLTQVSVTTNTAVNAFGGGMAVNADAMVVATGLTAQGNTAPQGGAIVVRSDGASAPTLRIFGGDVSSNVASNGSAGAILATGTNANLECRDATISMNASAVHECGACRVEFGARAEFFDTSFTNNAAQAGAGALSLAVDGTVSLVDCELRGNTAGHGGGAVVVGDPSATAPTFSAVRCRFVANACGQSGGAVACFGGATTVFESCLIAANVAGQCGPATALADGVHAFVGVTADDNLGGCAHNAVFLQGSATLTAANSILRGASGVAVEVGSGASFVAASCDVSGGWPGVGNFDAAPAYADAPNGDYRLTSGSPCRDAGADALATGVTDLDRGPRILGPSVDVGASEYAAAMPGSGDGLILAGAVDGAGGLDVAKVAAPGAQIAVSITSPTGAFVGAVPLLIGNLFPSTAGLPSPTSLPYVHVDPATMVVLFDGAAPAPFFVFVLPPAGLSLGLTTPPGLSGFALRLQAAALSAAATNGLFAASDAQEIHFL